MPLVLDLATPTRDHVISLQAPPTHESAEWFKPDPDYQVEGSGRNLVRLFAHILVTLSLWYSVAIGVGL